MGGAAGTPGVATLFGGFKEAGDGFLIRPGQGLLELPEFGDVGGQGAAQVFAVGQGDVAPHLGGAGSDAGGVPEAGGAEGGAGGQSLGLQDLGGQRGGDDVREMAGPADQGVVFARGKLEGAGAEGVPKFGQGAHGGGRGFRGGGDDADGVDKQIDAGGEDAGFFGTGHGMAAHKGGTGPGDEGFEVADDGGLDAADIGDDGTRFQGGELLGGDGAHLGERGAENDEVGAGDGGEEVGGGVIEGTGGFAIGEAGGAADVTGDLTREAAFFDGQANGAAEQADTDDCDFPKFHGRRIAKRRGKGQSGLTRRSESFAFGGGRQGYYALFHW